MIVNETTESGVRIAAVEAGVGALGEKVDAGFRNVDERFQQVDERFQRADERFAKIDATLAAHGRRLDDIEGHFPDLHAFIQFCFGELKRQMEEGFRDSREKFQRLELKVDRLADVVSRRR